MKALVLSGGKGMRLRPFTYSMPKQLVPVANKPVIIHCLETIRDIGIRDIGVVVGDQGEQIKAVVGDGSSLGLRISYIRQEAPLGLAHCVLIAGEFLGDDDFVMYLGDNMLIGGIGEAAEAFRARRSAAKLLVAKVDDPSQYGIAELDAAGRITALVEKPAQPRSDLAIMGVYFFTAAIHQAVRRIRPSRRGELEITDAIQDLLERGHPVVATEYTGFWKDTGKIDDLLECNRVLLDGLAADHRGEIDEHSRVTGPVVIEPGGRIVRSRVAGPVIVGAGCVVLDSVIGAHTVLGRGCEVANAEISESIVFEDATIRGVSGIRNSLIGRGAEVHGSDSSGHRLLVGDHSRMEIAV